MTYILTATKAEAQAFVEVFRLRKHPSMPFPTYTGTSMHVCVCGIAKEQVYRTTELFLRRFRLDSRDTIWNVGIAAAPTSFAIGSVVPITTLRYKNQTIRLKTPKNGATLTSVDTPCTEPLATLADMEGFFIAETLSQYDLRIVKVVSDHFRPHRVTPDFAKKLLKPFAKTMLKTHVKTT